MTDTAVTQPFKTLILGLLRQSHLDEQAFLQQLTETEQTAIGTWNLWSAKDHVAHTLYWHRDLVLKLTALIHHQELVPNDQDEDHLNATTFEQNKLRLWSDIHAEAGSQRFYQSRAALAPLNGDRLGHPLSYTSPYVSCKRKKER